MSKIILILFILSFCTESNSQDEKVYLAQTVGRGGFIIEDHITYRQNAGTWGKDEPANFDNYAAYIRDIVKKYARYNDTISEYYIEGWKDEFAKLTNIKPGDSYYISAPERIYKAEITRYFINFIDEIGGGVIFYPMAEYVPRNKIPDYEILVCSPNASISKMDNTGISEKKELGMFKSKLLPMLKNVRYSNWVQEKEQWKEVTSIADDEIKIFKGNFTGKYNEYLVSYTKRLSFDSYASAVLIMDENGNIIQSPSPLVKSDFVYTTAVGTVDYNGDGTLEIIIESGYYEGRGYELWKYTKEGYISIASGFYFGV